MDNSSDNWCEYLDSALCAMNTSLENIMMFGRNSLFPLEAEKEGSIDKAIDTIPHNANCSWWKIFADAEPNLISWKTSTVDCQARSSLAVPSPTQS